MSPSPKTTQTINYIPHLKHNKKQWSAVTVGEGYWVNQDHQRFETSWLVEGSILLDPVLFSMRFPLGSFDGMSVFTAFRSTASGPLPTAERVWCLRLARFVQTRNYHGSLRAWDEMGFWKWTQTDRRKTVRRGLHCRLKCQWSQNRVFETPYFVFRDV